MRTSPTVASEVSALRAEFAKYVHTERGIPFPAVKAYELRLALIAKLARLQESELIILRTAEDGQRVRTTIRNAATDSLRELVQDPEGKVLRPEFRKKDE